MVKNVTPQKPANAPEQLTIPGTAVNPSTLPATFRNSAPVKSRRLSAVTYSDLETCTAEYLLGAGDLYIMSIREIPTRYAPEGTYVFAIRTNKGIFMKWLPKGVSQRDELYHAMQLDATPIGPVRLEERITSGGFTALIFVEPETQEYIEQSTEVPF